MSFAKPQNALAHQPCNPPILFVFAPSHWLEPRKGSTAIGDENPSQVRMSPTAMSSESESGRVVRGACM